MRPLTAETTAIRASAMTARTARVRRAVITGDGCCIGCLLFTHAFPQAAKCYSPVVE